MEKNSKIYVAGHSGLIGSHIVEYLQYEGYTNIITKISSQLNLTDFVQVEEFMNKEKPEYVFLAAGKLGGVEEYQKKPVEYFTESMKLEMNIIECAYKFGVKKLVFVSTSCIYPESEKKIAEEDDFGTGWVQASTESYGLAKAVGTRLCQYYNSEYGTNFVTVFLTNAYGITDLKHRNSNSLLTSMISRFQKATEENINEVKIWGNGNAMREFIHARDAARALVKIMESKAEYDMINLGSGEMVTINELAKIVADVTKFEGKITHDLTKSSGSTRARLDISRLKKLGWKSQVTLIDGITELVNNEKREYK